VEVLFAANQAAIEVVPGIVRRHRSQGILTWRLLHQIEGEVVTELAASGRYNPRMLDMLRSPSALDYPKDERPVSFEGHDFVPGIFTAIHDAWRQVD
jgi:hypothetical protein